MPSHSEPVLVLDPAMLTDEDDSEYEYEYHEADTETFYLNLDLTSHHGPIRPPRRRDPASSTTAASRTPSAVPTPTDENDPTTDIPEIHNVPSERVQILGLHTLNPIVSYQNQIFSCSWADQIGTELFFTAPETTTDPDPETTTPHISPLKHSRDYDLIAANSVKILGRKANLISSSGPGPNQETPNADILSQAPGVVRRPLPQTNQARFLERLMSIKKARGETDTVRTAFSSKRTQNLEDRLRGWARTDGQIAEIQRLNDAALQGNTNALEALEDLYAQIGSQDAGPSEQSSQPH